MRALHRAIGALLVVVGLSACVPQPPPPVTVTRVVDGDTIKLSDGETVRLIGIDTPETHKPGVPVQCYGPEAAAHTAALLPVGTAVVLVLDLDHLDRYGRTLAYVYRLSDNLFVNLDLVANGYARVLTIRPNVAHQSEFENAQTLAQALDAGLWGSCPAA